MDKLIEDLLAIEHNAKLSLGEINDERAALSQKIADEITRLTLEIKRKADKEIQAIKQEEEDYTKAMLAEIESGYQKKASYLKQLFDTNMDSWRKDWFDQVLYIS